MQKDVKKIKVFSKSKNLDIQYFVQKVSHAYFRFFKPCSYYPVLGNKYIDLEVYCFILLYFVLLRPKHNKK